MPALLTVSDGYMPCQRSVKEEQVCTRAAGEVQHGYSALLGSKVQAYEELSTTEAEVQASVSAGRVAI